MSAQATVTRPRPGTAEWSAACWAHLVRLEPRLAGVLDHCKSVKPQRGKPFCANRVWYGSYPDEPCDHPAHAAHTAWRDDYLERSGQQGAAIWGMPLSDMLAEDVPADSHPECPRLSPKGRIVELVGWYAPASSHKALHRADAYDVAYETCYEALPHCRRCLCL